MSENRKIIFISQVFHPDTCSTSILFSPLMQAISENGVSVEVWTGFPSAGGRELLSKHEWWNGVEIRRCGLHIDHKASNLKRALAYFSFLISVFSFLILKGKGRDVIGVTNPPFLAWILYAASKIVRIRYTYIFLDLHPEGLIALNKLQRGNFFICIWKLINGLAYRAAEKLCVLGRDMTPLLKENYQIDDTRVVYFPHWSPVESVDTYQFENSNNVKKLGLSGNFVVQYSGNMGLWHDIDSFIKSANLLKAHRTIQFLFVGNGMRRDQAQKLASSLTLSNITWTDFVPIEELEDSLAGCHVSLISLNQGLSGVAVPCKLYGILASGRAIIAQVPHDSEVALTIAELDCGVVVEPGNFKALAEAVLKLERDPSLTARYGSNARNGYLKKYRLKNAVDLFLSQILPGEAFNAPR